MLGLELRVAEGCSRGVVHRETGRPVWSQALRRACRLPATGAAPPACPPTDRPPSDLLPWAGHTQLGGGCCAAKPGVTPDTLAEGPRPLTLAPFSPWSHRCWTPGLTASLEAEQGSGPCGRWDGVGEGTRNGGTDLSGRWRWGCSASGAGPSAQRGQPRWAAGAGPAWRPNPTLPLVLQA